VEYSGSVTERIARTSRAVANEGDFSGRFGFRPSLGAPISVEWEYEHRQGDMDRPWEYTHSRERGSMILQGLAEDVPAKKAERFVEETRDDKRALFHGLVIGGVFLVIGLLVGFVG
jgi:hypothetical protein